MDTVFQIGESKYNVVKKGREQATQVARLGQWLSMYGVNAYRNADEGNVLNGIELISAVLSALSPDALIELFILVFGCTQDEANEHFDAALLIDGVTAIYEGSPTLMKVVNRFFSSSNSDVTESVSSTPSE